MLTQDLRYGLRILRKSPSFTAAALITLALGIGANTAIFSVVNAVLLRPLPYPHPERLVEVWQTTIGSPARGPVSPADFFDWERMNTVFEGMAALPLDQEQADFTLLGRDKPERLRGQGVTGNLFSVLGVPALIGRGFYADETWKGKNQVAIISYGLWKRLFDANPNIVGKPITLDERTYSIIGVMPRDFYFPRKDIEVWVPFGFDPAAIPDTRSSHSIRVIARLKPGVSIKQAQSQMEAVAAELEREHPETNANLRAGIAPLRDWTVSDSRVSIVVVLGAGALLLLIACANVAALLLARGTTRIREAAVRAGLGASRFTLLRQSLTESLILSVLGSALGLVLALWGKSSLLSFSPGRIPRLDESRIDGVALAFTMAITLVTTLMFGLVPALTGSKTDLAASLKQGGPQTGGGAHGGKARSLFIVLEVAFTIVALIGAGLIIESFVRLERVDPGFDPEHILTLRISLPSTMVPNPAGRGLLIGVVDKRCGPIYEQTLDRIRGVPTVIAAGATNTLPLQGAWGDEFTIEGRPPSEHRDASIDVVSPGYFQAMGVPLIAGRTFDRLLDNNQSHAVVVNQSLARGFFGGEPAVGKQLKPAFGGPPCTIIGVVKNERPFGLAADPGPEVYFSYLRDSFSQVTLVIRTNRDPKAIVGAARDAIWSVNKDIAVYNAASMKEILYGSIARERFTTLLLAFFGALALILSTIGIYGIMSYTISQRTREVGVRMALGAVPRQVVAMVTGQSLGLTSIGMCLGLIVAFALTRLMSSLLFGISTTDPLAFGGAAALVEAAAILAALVPARRAAKVDPIEALRSE